MGQSAKRKPRLENTAIPEPSLSVFPTKLGWCGVAGRTGRAIGILIGHFDADAVRRAFALRLAEAGAGPEFTESDWSPALRRQLERYCLGHPVSFEEFELELPKQTPFQRRVVKVTREIAYGKTMSYGELARRAGFDRAARAVGSVMASNRFPIVIPCHRVVAAAGKLGGYTAPQGTDLKARLLAMEAESA